MRCGAQLVVWLVLLTLLSACGSYRSVAALDSDERAELQALTSELRGRTFRIDDPVPRHCDLPDRIATLGLIESPRSELRVRVERWDSGGWWNSTHTGRFAVTFLTLAIVPVIYTDEAGWRVRVERSSDGAARTVDAQEVRRDWRGWLMLPVAVLPGWRHYSVFAIPDEDDEAREDEYRLDRATLSVLRLMADLLAGERAEP